MLDFVEETMAEDKVVANFKRNPTEEVRAGIKEFKGRRYIDLRIYYMDDQGEWNSLGPSVDSGCIC